MYLHKKTYVKNWNHMKPEAKTFVTVSGAHSANIKPERISEISEEMGYWRKANAIHAWFVENVQEGEDDCGDYCVDEEKMQELLDIVNKILDGAKMVKGQIVNGYRYENEKKTPILEDGEIMENAKLAHELLPTQEGFFFGGTDYDQYYIDDLKHTKEILEVCLAEDKNGGCGTFYYGSSW